MNVLGWMHAEMRGTSHFLWFLCRFPISVVARGFVISLVVCNIVTHTDADGHISHLGNFVQQPQQERMNEMGRKGKDEHVVS